MTPAAILQQALASGVTLLAEGGVLRYRGPRKAIEELLPTIKAHKTELLDLLQEPGMYPTAWRVTLADGKTLEHRVPSGLTETEALALSRSWGEPLKAKPIQGVSPWPPPADLDALLAQACQGVEGIDSATFKSKLSPEDLEDIAGGHYSAESLRAYARSFAQGLRPAAIADERSPHPDVCPSELFTKRCREWFGLPDDLAAKLFGILSGATDGTGITPEFLLTRLGPALPAIILSGDISSEWLKGMSSGIASALRVTC